MRLNATDTVSRDAILNMLGALIVVTVLMVPWLNDPTKSDAVETPGVLMISAVWPAKSEADVDLWVEAPVDGVVGYSRPHSTVLNLLRDDLGKLGDLTDANIEYTFARSTPPGEYVINLHLYRDNASDAPFEVLVVGTLIPPGRTPQVIFSRKITLTFPNEELTVARFNLDETGRLVPGLSDVFKPLRAKTGVVQ